MNRRCGCEYGGDCTKTSVCAIETAVEDATDALTAEIDQLKKAIYLMNAQLIAGEGVDIMHYLERPYPSDPVIGNEDIVELIRGMLAERAEWQES